LEVYALLGFRNIFVCQMIYVMTWDFGFIAGIHNSAKMWVSLGNIKCSYRFNF
jgi:hypothetical protein